MVKSESFKHEEVLGLKFGYAPIGKPRLSVYIYLVDGLLIDTGQRKASKQIIEATENLAVDKIFITHHHEDHTGNIHTIQERHRCKVYGSEKCSQIMKNPPKISAAQQLVWGSRAAYNHIVPVSETIKTNKYNFQIIPIPGHATDMVALFEPEQKWLFSADLFINSYIGYFLNGESMQDQIESTRRILGLDFEVMFCAHNPQLTGAKNQLKRKLGFLELFFEQVAILHKKGYSEKQIFKSLKLKEDLFVKFLSGGQLSKLNMVRSVIKDIDRKP
ncbi:MAG: MBL fold metallo-hydrolase [Bacteroidota bacterium]